MVNHFINGQAVSVGGYSSDLFNPSTGAKIGSVLNAGAEELGAAAQAAHKAFGSWSAKGLGHRAEILLACRQMILEHRDALIEICTLEAGKTFADASAEVDKGIEGLAYGASIAVNSLAWGDFLKNAGVVVRKEIMRTLCGNDTCRNALIGNGDMQLLCSLSLGFLL